MTTLGILPKQFLLCGSIDGYSRTILYLHCAGNNRASTAFIGFSTAVSTHGLSQRVCTYCGGENVEIWRFMV